MSEMVSNDVKNGMDLLMTKLLPMVIEKLKNAEAKIAELETKVEALTAKPKRTRTKKAVVAGEVGPTGPCGQAGTPDFGDPADTPPVVKTDNSNKKPFALTDEQLLKIHDLYQHSLGVDFDNVEVLTDEDGNNLTVNDSPVTTEIVDSIKQLLDANPAATVQDVCNELKQPCIVVCFVMVMFNL